MAKAHSKEQRTLWDLDEPRKECSDCLQCKPLSEFSIKRDKRVPRHQAYCRACAALREKARKDRDPETYRQRKRTYRTPEKKRLDAKRRGRLPHVRKRQRELQVQAYGMTIADYDAMLIKQRGRCAICGRGFAARTKLGKKAQLCIDHDHTSMRVRGLLCCRCNGILGYVGDSPEILKNAAAYLEFHKQTPSSFVVPGPPP